MFKQLFLKIKPVFVICGVVCYCVLGLWIAHPATAQDTSRIDQSRIQNKFQQIDSNEDGAISLDEMGEHETQRGKTVGNRFKQTDTDADGFISMDEFAQHEIEKGQGNQRPPGETNNEEQQPPEQNENLSNITNQRIIQGQNKYSIEQAISDRAQLNTIAFNGLGLSIAEQIAKMHKGKLIVKSNVDKGSTFTVFLPRAL